jgi:hypothetical protein
VGRYATELNPKIRAVLVAAQLEHGMSAAETARAAQAGELEGLPPTRVSETTCRELAAEARREQSTQSNGSAASESDETRELGEAMAAEAEERAYFEQQIARIKALDEPTAKQLSIMRTALHVLEDIDRRRAKRAARRRRPAEQEAGCRHLNPFLPLGPCTCTEPCFGAWAFADYQREKRAEAEGRPKGCCGYLPEGAQAGDCYGCEPLADHDRLYYDVRWHEQFRRAYPELYEHEAARA